MKQETTNSEEINHGTHHEYRNDWVGSNERIDGYSGPRASMVYGKQYHSVFEADADLGHRKPLDLGERITSGSLSIGFIAMLLASVILVPAALVLYSVYSGITWLLRAAFNRSNLEK